ncbi:MAG TPA: FtsX-like permease family protein [Candidatus Acidoferrales bacterium]|nr:FtsX-like permease family protein [Candidatus Acidoferrales bacterium]
MFKRLLFHLLRGNRVRLVVALLALISGGAVVSALMNLDLDINHKLTQEFRSLGANLIISPPQIASAAPGAPLMNESLVRDIAQNIGQDIGRPSQASDTIASPDLYVVARAGSKNEQNVVVTGTWLDRIWQMEPWWKIDGTGNLPRTDLSRCLIGRNVSRSLSLSAGSNLALSYQGRTVNLAVAGIADAGGSEDNQIFVNLPVAQKLAGLDGKIQLIQLSVLGSADQIRSVEDKLQSAFPALEVKAIPQITEAEGKLLEQIRFLIFSMGFLILVLTALCVLATMAALAMERRRDVGLMKALGGSIQKVVGLFLTEVGVLGTVGGILGYALGMGLSIWMGHRVFGTSISPRWEVLPATVILMLGVALAGALPLRLLGNVRPAVILRGE